MPQRGRAVNARASGYSAWAASGTRSQAAFRPSSSRSVTGVRSQEFATLHQGSPRATASGATALGPLARRPASTVDHYLVGHRPCRADRLPRHLVGRLTGFRTAAAGTRDVRAARGAGRAGRYAGSSTVGEAHDAGGP